MTHKVRNYTPGDFDTWNAFIDNSKNGTFLFHRNYMDYHSDRFLDCSLLVLDDRDRLVAVLPASRQGTTITSHMGLTYGGIISDQRMTTAAMLEVMESIRAFLKAEGAEELEYKTMPAIYHKIPSQEDAYALFRHDARLVRRDVLSVVNYSSAYVIQERRLRGVKKAEKVGVSFGESSRWAEFWAVLEQNLHERYGRKPVHSLAEMTQLRDKFPSRVRLFTAEKTSQVVGGAVMYLTDTVAHVQYIASSEIGRDSSALDLLFLRLIEEFSSYRYFDFGISTEQSGQYLNTGLVDFKEGFGARAYVHDHYALSLS